MLTKTDFTLRYKSWLVHLDRALKAAGHAKGVFGYSKDALDVDLLGDCVDEPGDVMALEADRVAALAGLTSPRLRFRSPRQAPPAARTGRRRRRRRARHRSAPGAGTAGSSQGAVPAESPASA